ncbi:Aste57867_14835 [Aphanomyces stellatus]|uniref:Aste57867_14835 protein n=1 Tax=Aphanomyces stellatus TaxID=120398 RepID=A0A485L2L6_9STRA|nr:hypothetical protein As57867_014779 [Aphanomyces stellatus]VFT91653.1 Aste57867_14835 [Aphanomyces stellatus]
MRVHPTDARRKSVPTVQYDNSPRQVLLGSLYLIATIASSVYYLSQLQPAFANDLWWSRYNASGHQALLMDLVNAFLVNHGTGNLNLVAPSSMVDTSYASLSATTAVHPSYVRRLVFHDLTSLAFAVPALRAMQIHAMTTLPTQLCWIDFDQAFEVAHTEARQQRCAERYQHNGAVYMEPILRNQNCNAFMALYGGDGGLLAIPLLVWLDQVPAGQQWLAQSCDALATTSMDDEIAYWHSKYLTSYTLQWHNNWQPGIAETLGMTNALGMQHILHVKNIPRSVESWTSQTLNWFLLNDLILLNHFNCSLVRLAPNAHVQILLPLTLEDFLGLQDPFGTYINQIELFRTAVGPFNAVDAYYVAVPPALLALYDSFRSALFQSLAADSTCLSAMDGLSDMVLTPTPPAWVITGDTVVFYGGNPLCVYGHPQSYVQDTFSFYDVCAIQPPLRVTVTKYATVFATVATMDTFQSPATCALAVERSVCRMQLDLASAMVSAPLHVVGAMTPHLLPAANAVDELHVGIMQYASDVQQIQWTLLQQPLVDPTAWSFYGWVLLYDWVEGRREVVSFEGDVMSVVLISAADAPQPFPTTRETVPTATRAVFYLMSYVTAVLVVVALACFVSMLCNGWFIRGQNLYWFNRVVGSIWVGRPLLFTRGVTAIVLLSSAQLELQLISSAPHARFQFVSRPWLATLIVAGEATWILYVAQDFLLIATENDTTTYAPLSALLAWLITASMTFVSPVEGSLTLERICTSDNMGDAIHCTVGDLSYGSFERITLLFAVEFVSLFVPLVLVRWFSKAMPRWQPESTFNRHVLGVADTFLISSHEPTESHWSMDSTSCIMAGLIPLVWRNTSYTFDLKLWVVHRDIICTKHYVAFDYDETRLASTMELKDWTKTTSVSKYDHVCRYLKLLGGIAYVGLAIFGSISYLQVSQVNLANDMFWANFNMTGTHVFFATWLNRLLILDSTDMTLQLTNDTISIDGPFDTSLATVPYASKYGSLLQYTKYNSIDVVIPALRSTDGCSVPWIFTQYCFADFNHQWQMASSQARQARCQTMTSNGAIYLESILRNIHSTDFFTCWGDAFNAAIANELRTTIAGQMWLNNTFVEPKLSVSDEMAMWKSHNIRAFQTQWQNYKAIGLVNSYAVLNGYGGSSRFTLQYQHSSFRFQKQTTLKMYWGIANDLVAVMQNGSALNGGSLIRSSARFAFANTTPESVLIQNGTLESPLGTIFAILHTVIGPFGSVDMLFMPCPVELKSVVHAIFLGVRQTLFHTRDDDMVNIYNHIGIPSAEIVPAPKAWTDLGFLPRGGSLLCPEVSFQSAPPISNGLAVLTSWDMPCLANFMWTSLNPTPGALITALFLANVSFDDIRSTCAQNENYQASCQTSLNHTLTFVERYMTMDKPYIAQAAVHATHVVQALAIEFIQFGQLPDPSADIALYRLNVLDPTQVEFTYFAWLFLIDWAEGRREAISFQGDSGTINVLTEYLAPVNQQINLGENGTNLSLYLRGVVLYVTYAMLVIATLTLLYMAACRGHVEVRNLALLERIGAIVWIGRPLLFARSLSALILLSTCTLDLTFNGSISYFQVTHDPWYKTALAANEVSWIVSIVNDIAMSITREFTTKYTRWDSPLVLLTTVILSLLFPVTHAVTISIQCALVQVDAQIECESARLDIGQVTRFLTLWGVVLGWNVLCYVGARMYYRGMAVGASHVHSIFLYAGARYHFRSAAWIYQDTYYMDRMSAMLNGILTIHWDNAIFGLDIKLWRAFRMEFAKSHSVDDPTLRHFASTTLPIPLQLGTDDGHESSAAPTQDDIYR